MISVVWRKMIYRQRWCFCSGKRSAVTFWPITSSRSWGRDNRLSSKRVRDNLISGLTTAGCRVVDLGEVISPILYYAREHLKINAAIMITASHNPPEFNGFKVAPRASHHPREEIQKVYHLMEEMKGEIPRTPLTPAGPSRRTRSGCGLFTDVDGKDPTGSPQLKSGCGLWQRNRFLICRRILHQAGV